jgi:hypothetical protein
MSRVDSPLPVHGADHPALQETRRGLVGRQALPFGCGAGDLLQPPDRVVLVDGQGDEQDADEIARLCCARRCADRCGHRDFQVERAVEFSAACEERAGSACDRAQQHVVDGRVMCVCGLPGLFEVGTHEHDAVLPADRPVERRARSPALASELQGLAEQRPDRNEGPRRVSDLVHASADAGD